LRIKGFAAIMLTEQKADPSPAAQDDDSVRAIIKAGNSFRGKSE
jgi:hypothetical protein